VLFARDRTAGLDKQVVGYRIVIQYADVSSAGPYTSLAGSASSIAKVKTSDHHVAHLPARTYVFAPGVSEGHNYWRVVVQMYWYRPGSSTVVEGRAGHAPSYYEGSSNPFMGSCFGGD
jgi:hypothetical protein